MLDKGEVKDEERVMIEEERRIKETDICMKEMLLNI
jgi:hypothetical protein